MIDPRTLVPLDEETIPLHAETGRLLIALEAVGRGGWGVELAARPVPMPYNDSLGRATIPTQGDIAAAAMGLL